MLKKLLLSLIIGVIIFLLSGPFVLKQVEGWFEPVKMDFDQVKVGEEVNQNGFRQIYLEYQGEKTLLTTENTTHSAVSRSGEYITWMSQLGSNWQIFLHHIPSGKTVQLTNTGNNVNPHIDAGRVVWEGQIKGVWQALIFDGSKIYQITTSSMPVQDVDIENEHIVYSIKRVNAKGWDIYYYNYLEKTANKLTSDVPGHDLVLENGVVKWKTYQNNNLAYYKYDIAKDQILLVKDVFLTTPETTSSITQIEGFNVNSYLNFLSSIGQSPTPALKVLLEQAN